MRAILCLFLLGWAAAAPPARRAEEFSSGAGVVRITPIRHASLMIEAGGQVIHVDPVSQGNYEGLPAADLILLTDIHGDHFDPALIAKLRKSGAVAMGPEAAREKTPGLEVIRNGESKTFGPWKIEALAAYNVKRGPSPGKLFHEKGRGNGYVLGYGGKRFYISGDTEAVPEMKALRAIDVAFVCMNLPYTMPPEEAAEAVRAFAPKVVYPYHYRGSDLAVFQKALAGAPVEARLRDWYD